MSKNHDIDSTRQVVLRARNAGLGVKPGLVLAILQELEETRARHRKAWGRAEAAEAAVQRVRELVMEAQSRVSQMNMPRVRTLSGDILRALDGGEQE